VGRPWFRWGLYDNGEPLGRLRGITKPEASALAQALGRLVLRTTTAEALAWHAEVAASWLRRPRAAVGAD
jgi:hypothetical protein